MKVIILGAGQGKRLLPLTAEVPKALLDIGGRSLVGRQIDAFTACGVSEFAVVTGYAAGRMEEALDQIAREKRVSIKTIFNPFFGVADNLASCWMARHEMKGEFIQVNGDNLFKADLVKILLSAPEAPVTVAINHKPAYDADDMKVQLDESGWVKHVSKTLPTDQIDAESIGLVFFREHGPQLFRDAIEAALRHQTELKSWYLSIIDALAQKQLVKSCSISQHLWCEIDFAVDLARAEALFGRERKDDVQSRGAPAELVMMK